MKFEPGREKTGGRKKGIPNKETIGLREQLDRYGIEPIRDIASLLPQLSPEKQVDIYRELLQYLYPKRKAVEMQVEVATERTVPKPMTTEEFKILLNTARGPANQLSGERLEQCAQAYIERQGARGPSDYREPTATNDLIKEKNE